MVAVEPAPVQIGGASQDAAELSGIAPVPGHTDQYGVVSDQSPLLHRLQIQVDAVSGGVVAAAWRGEPMMLQGAGADLEGLVSIPTGWAVVSEARPGISVHDADGGLIQRLETPAIFIDQHRQASSFESLASWGDWLVTANEEPLASDEYMVRLLFYQHGEPVKQVALALAATRGDFRRASANGLVELCFLPDGGLLVLERAMGLGLGAQLRTRNVLRYIDRADWIDSPDVSGTERLADTSVAVPSTELWRQRFGDQNYEGMTLGPALDDGRLSLLLVSDNGRLEKQTPLGRLVFEPEQTVLGLVLESVEP